MNSLETVLRRAAVRTFEELSFLLPDPDIEPDRLSIPARAAVSVPFRGPVNGRLVVAVTEDIFLAVATNMLAEDDLPSDQQRQDALKEIANVICGNLLPQIAGAKAVFKISAPELLDTSSPSEPVTEEPLAASVQVGLDQGRADVTLFMSGANKHSGVHPT